MGTVAVAQGLYSGSATEVQGRVISVTYHDDLKEVQGDPALAALLGAPAATAPFDRLAWWRALAEECAILPLIAVARCGGHRAVMPLMRDRRQIKALANWYSFAVRPLATPGADRFALIKELAADLAGEAPHLVLAPLPDEDGSATELCRALRAAGWTTFLTPCDTNHYVELGGRGYAAYLADRPGALRSTLKRKGSKVSCEILTGFDEAAWRAYEAIYAQSWKPSEGHPAFLRRFACEEGAAGRLRLGIARAEGTPVAAQMWTVEAGTAFIHKLAHTEASKPLSPGTSLSAALFEHVIDVDKVTSIDFGTGNDAYKRDWMESVRPRYRIEALRPFHPGCWPRITRLVLRGLAGRHWHG